MRGKLAAFKMPAQDFGPTWEDWVDAAFRMVIDTKRSVISRTDSERDAHTRWDPHLLAEKPELSVEKV